MKRMILVQDWGTQANNAADDDIAGGNEIIVAWQLQHRLEPYLGNGNCRIFASDDPKERERAEAVNDGFDYTMTVSPHLGREGGEGGPDKLEEPLNVLKVEVQSMTK